MNFKQMGLILGLSIALNSVGAGQKTTLDTINALVIQGETYRQTGHLHEAESVFKKALASAEQLSNAKAQSLTTGLLGYLYLQQHHYLKAKPLLEQALKMAEQHGWPALAGLYVNYLGNYHSSQRQSVEAKDYYEKSLAWALKAQEPALAVQAKLNLSRLESTEGQTEQAWKRLKEVSDTLETIMSITDRIGLSLQTGYQLLTFSHTNAINKTARIKLAYQVLNTASELAVQHADLRSQSLSQGYLGQLYELQNRPADALILTEQAVDIAQRIDAKELLLQWEWQRGRLLKALDQPKSALSAYRRAVDYIQAIRQDIPVHYQQGRSSFRDTFEPVYLGLVDLLFQQAGQLDVSQTKQVLQEARQTIELIKKTELEDYFQNRCVIQTLPEVNLEGIAPKTATIYPIMLPDRLELLVGIGNDIYHQTVPIAATEVKNKARILAKRLRRRQPRYIESAQQLYQWLIDPIDDLLKNHKIDTLVVVPDSELRLVPFSALFDGQKYLIERYAVAISPGLTLLDPKLIPRKGVETLLAGLSQPGPVVKSLPLSMLQVLVSSVLAQTENEIISKKNRDIGDLFVKRGQSNSQLSVLTPEKIQSLLDNPIILKKTQQALALPGVEKEINKLSELFSTTTLINENFVTQRLNDEIHKSPYRVLHIASHGFFGHSSEQSFIMTYDQILTMDKLENLLHSENFGNSPIELLTLSACQTAEGDDRSPLGLSGIALKAKVRSVLGSLWSVSDDATVLLMQAFYQRLNSADLTKAQALQQAQIRLLKDRERSHPFFWSPFILIGSWL